MSLKTLSRQGIARSLPELWSRPAVTLLLAGVLSAFVAACGDGGMTAAEHLERAEQYQAEGKAQAAVIEFKNAIQKAPDNADARLGLGKAYVQVADFSAAQKELLRARELGAGEEDIILPLAQTWIALGKADRVLSEFQADEDAAPEYRADVFVAQGRAQVALGDADAARTAFNEALALQPDNVHALTGLGTLDVQAGSLDSAQDLLDRAAAVAPEDPAVLGLRGDLAMRQQRYEDAVAVYKALYKSVPQNFWYRLALARAQMAAGDDEEAIQHLDALVSRAPGSAEVNYLRALAAFRLKDYETAKQYAEKAVAAADNLPSRRIAGAANYALGNFEQAANHLRYYVSNAPADTAIVRLYGRTLLQLGQADRAREVLEALVQSDTDDPELLAMVGTAAVRSGDLKGGETYFERLAATESDAGSAAARAQLGAIRISTGEVEQGVRDLQQALEQNPKLDQALLALTLTHLRQKEFDKALSAAEKLKENLPNDPAGATLAGIAYVGMGDRAKAREAFREALQIRPGAPDASSNLAVLALQEGKTDEALALLREAAEKNPDHVATVTRLAQLEARQGEVGKAQERLQAFLRTHPHEQEPRLLLAELYVNSGELQKALDLTEGQLAIQPDNPGLLAVVGRARLARGNTDEALADLKKLADLRPDSADAHMLLAEAYRRKGDQALYRQQLERALDLQADRTDAKLQLAALALAQGDSQTFERLMGDLKETVPNDPALLELEAARAMQQGQVSEAVVALKKAAELRPSTEVTAKLATAQQQAGNVQAGRETLQRWLEEHPDDWRVEMVLANMELADERFEAAREGYTAVLDQQPDNVVALNNLAWLLWNGEQPEAALPHVERALRLAPDAPAIKDTAGMIYLALGNTDRAVELLQEAAQKLPGNPDIQYHYAQALAAANREDEAKNVLAELLSSASDFPARAEAEQLFKRLGG